MLSCRPACHRAVQRRVPSFSDSIWISDDILATHFERFVAATTLRCKRRGSSVPGPLEASRRLARRRMMNLSVTEGSAIDTSILPIGFPASVPPQWRWEPPIEPRPGIGLRDNGTYNCEPYHGTKTIADPTSATPQLPDWLTSDVPQLENEAPDYRLEAKATLKRTSGRERLAVGDIMGKRSHSHSNANSIRLRLALGSVKTVHDIHRLLHEKQLQACICRDPSWSKYLFEKLLRLGSSPGDLAEYLVNPAVNVPEAHNTVTILKFYMKRSLETEHYSQLEDILGQLLEVGMLSNFDIRVIIQHLPLLADRVFVLNQDRESAKISTLATLWFRIKTCPVFTVRNLEAATLNSLLAQINRLTSSPQTQSLTLDIIKSARQEDLNHIVRPASDFLAKWFVEWGEQTNDGERNPCKEALTLLRTLPRSASQLLIRSTTALLQERANPASGQECALGTTLAWINMVSKCQAIGSRMFSDELRAAEGLLAASGNIHTIAAYLKEQDHLEIAIFFFRFLVHKASHRRDKSPTRVIHRLSHLIHEFRSLCHDDLFSSPFTNVIRLATQRGLPFGHAVGPMVQLLREIGLYKEIRQLFAYCKQRKILVKSAILGEHISIRSQTDRDEATAIFKDFQGLKLHLCGDFAVNTIKCPSGNPSYIWRLVQSQLPWRCFDSDVSRPHVKKFKSFEPRIKLIYGIAEAYAHAEHLAPSTAFRYVYRCYRYLRSRRVECRPELARAMVHAGITRALCADQKVGNEKLRLILRTVYEAEGDTVAHTLDELVYHWRGANIERTEGPSETVRGLSVDGQSEMEQRVYRTKVWRYRTGG
ncbi:MAG: hypothetical protein M1837_002969 [Sclerophora amabilis]|nr:MAG: hypothetical protein M1837_002969 [Sclerophora amabilis]